MEVRAAVAFAANTALEIVTLHLDPPGPGEVLVRLKAAGLCHSDLSVLEGKLSIPAGFPVILGHEGAGEVIECGPGVTSVVPGDHVIPVSVPECRQCRNCTSGKTNLCLEIYNPPPSRFRYQGNPVASFCALGTFAEYAVITETRLAKIRADAPDDVVCYIGCGVVTGVGAALETARVMPGSAVAIFGLGGIGLSVLQGARIAGATRIIGIDVNADREAIARKYGATDFINPNETEDVVAQIVALTGGGVDFSFECVGSVALMRQAVDASNPGWGVMVSVGIPGGGVQLTIDPAAFMRGRTWKGSLLGGAKTRTTVPKLVDWYADGFLHLDDLITHRLPLEAINEGFAMMKSGEAIRSVILY